MDPSIEQLVIQLREQLNKHAWKIVTAESCTGGGLAYYLTSIPGSSHWFERGFVTYSNNAKTELLGVTPLTLSTFGAVSEETVREMAEGALRNSYAELSIAITGIAGPDGGSTDKPIGTVWIGIANTSSPTRSVMHVFSGTRAEIREHTIKYALSFALASCKI